MLAVPCRVPQNYVTFTLYIEINGGRTTDKMNTQANKGSPLLSVEVSYQITLNWIRCSRGCLDRRGEKVIWEMFTENECNTFMDLKGKS